MNYSNGLTEIIFIGRGGQGVVTGAQLAGAAAFTNGIKDINVVPFFGAERRGAAVEAYLRLSNSKINIYSNIETADIIVVFDDSLLANIQEKRIKNSNTTLIINSNNSEIYKKINYYDNFKNIAVIDAAAAAKTINLYAGGALIINTAIIGAFAKATGLFDMRAIETVFKETFGVKNSEKNIKAAESAYNNVIII